MQSREYQNKLFKQWRDVYLIIACWEQVLTKLVSVSGSYHIGGRRSGPVRILSLIFLVFPGAGWLLGNCEMRWPCQLSPQDHQPASSIGTTIIHQAWLGTNKQHPNWCSPGPDIWYNLYYRPMIQSCLCGKMLEMAELWPVKDRSNIFKIFEQNI